MPPVISVENLSKCYRLGTIGGATLREDFARWTAKLCQKPDPTLKIGQEHHARLVGKEFWALDDVSFQVKEGEILGIIGRNGAGKSTLLKILSRVTAPSSGLVKIRGRVASLLEVGTGFHPELTGRENVFLNGAILGMTKAEIRKKFDEIVAFSEVGEFIDTPVKRYSSGMYVRLAFAVAAYLEPEILIVDEVLAVGDAQFQKKCLGKMGEVAAGGRTVLFVSHNMDAIRKLCSSAVLLHDGQLQAVGSTDGIVDEYLSRASGYEASSLIRYPEKPKTSFYIERIEILAVDGTPKHKVFTWDAIHFRVVFHSPRWMKNGSVVFQIATTGGTRLLLASTEPDQSFQMHFMEGQNAVEFVIPRLMLSAGKYQLGAALAIPNIEYLCEGLDYALLSVETRDVFKSGLPPQSSRYLIPMECHWQPVSACAMVRPSTPQ